MFLEMYFETINDKYIFFNHIILIHKPVNVLILIFLFLFSNVVFDTYIYKLMLTKVHYNKNTFVVLKLEM